MANAGRSVGPRLKYWEGYGTPGLGFPLDHGWCTLDDRIVDLTWAIDHKDTGKPWYKNRIIGVLPEGYSYFGMEVDPKKIYPFWDKHKFAASIVVMEDVRGHRANQGRIKHPVSS